MDTAASTNPSWYHAACNILPVETVIAVLAAPRDGASINAATKASGINYKTAKRIVEAAAEHRKRQLTAVGRRVTPSGATPPTWLRATCSRAAGR
jgi:hypothetical protein